MSAGGGGAEGDVELNIAPIIDCFTVLIAYLLVSISFISLKMVDVEVAATSDAVPPPAEVAPPPEVSVTLSVEIAENSKLQLKLTGGPKNIDETYAVEPNPDGTFNVEALKAKISEIKLPYPNLKEANVSAQPVVKYKAIVQVVQALKTNLTKVFLAS